MLTKRFGAFAAVLLTSTLVACEGDTTGPPAEVLPVRIVTFGDSNTDNGWSGTDPEVLVRSYISKAPLRLAPSDPHDPRQLAGKIEALWEASRTNPITVVNHAVGATTTGGGGFGGADRHTSGTPNARTEVHGIVRFEAEVLGHGVPEWDGGEPTNESYPDGPIARSNGFVPGPDDFAYVSLGTNDPSSGIETSQTLENLRWMVERWLAVDLPPSHFILTTLPPTIPPHGADFPLLNEEIRAIGGEFGIHVIDLAEHTSHDDGLTWRSDDLHIGDQLHYSEQVRGWLAEQVVSHMSAHLLGT